jgi:aconitate hydratase
VGQPRYERADHEVMVRGMFANALLSNRIAGRTDLTGGLTIHLPSGAVVSVYDAATRYGLSGTPLLVLAGKDYGCGSSRDWAAKGLALLGVRAVLAESFERIHRSNLVRVGVLPLALPRGESITSLGLTGEEHYDIAGGQDAGEVCVRTAAAAFSARVLIETPTEWEYCRHGGILPFTLRQTLARSRARSSRTR